MSNTKWNEILHVYAQDQWHEDAFIVGDRAALVKLRDAIVQALDGDADPFDDTISREGLGKTAVFAADGEGYSLHVVAIDAERMERMKLPYTGRMFNHPDAKGRYPSSLVRQRPGDEILDDDEWFAEQRRFGMEFEKPGPVDVIQAANHSPEKDDLEHDEDPIALWASLNPVSAGELVGQYLAVTRNDGVLVDRDTSASTLLARTRERSDASFLFVGKYVGEVK